MRIVKLVICSFLAVFCMTFFITGCSSMPRTQYSFAEGYSGGTATVTFGNRVSLRSLDEKELPPGDWAPGIIFPAGTPLNTTVHVSYDGRDHYSWTAAVFSGGGGGTTTREGAILVLLAFAVTLSRDILWSPVIIGDIATAKSQATNRDVTFLCPALESGKKYSVYFKRSGKKYFVYVKETGSGRIIHTQQFDRVEN